jgi:hypothetical protein
MQQEKIVRAMYMGHEIVARNFWKITREEFATEATLAFNGAIAAALTIIKGGEQEWKGFRG